MRMLIAVALAASLVSPSRPSRAKVDPPAASQAGSWLAAFNAGDRAALRRFLEVNAPSKLPDLDRMLDLRARTGGFDLKKAEESTDTRWTGLVQERVSDQFVRVVVEVEPAPPHRITALSFTPIPRPAEFQLRRMSEAELVTALRAKLDQETAADRFAGAVLLARNGRPVFSGAYGLADRERGTPNTLTTRFRLGSMNKMFTAVAVLQLVEAGKIGLDDPLGKYLTDYPNQDVASKVTIHHLLTHTGGTGDIFGPEFDAHRLELRTLQDYVTLYGTRGLAFAPGSRWEYSNYGFLLLGRVIERVTGTSYYDYVRDHIFAPAGMRSTASDPEDQPVADRAVGYTRMSRDGPPGGPWHPNTETLPYRGTSAGGGYSTVEDLVRFADALREHKLLDPHYTELLTTGKVAAMGDSRYAYGFVDRTVAGVRVIGHGGGAPGMNGDLAIYPQSGYVLAVLANLDPPAATHISEFVTNRLPEE